MTREELIAAIEAHIGLRTKPGRHGDEIAVLSPNGMVLFTISIFESANGWRFGGCGALLHSEWSALCAVGCP